MKRLVIAGVLTAGVLGAQAQTFVDQARVRNVDPQYENVVQPRNECTSQWVPERGNYYGREPQARQYGGAIVGGLAGGVLGNQIGGGSGKDAATALGVVLGAITGDRIENRNQGDPRGQYAQGQYGNGQYENAQREVQRCRTVNDTQTRLTGYRVTYDYHGQQYTTFMRNHPGQSLAVRVTVDPIER
jgi:uncharacterized protein YcfJ